MDAVSTHRNENRETECASVICDEMFRLNSMLPNAEGLVFDCDGTLLDTMPIYYESWKRTCDDVGLDFPIERFYEFAGAPVYDIFETLINEQGKDRLLDETCTLTASHCESLKRRHHQDIEAEGRIAGPIDIIVEIAHKYHKKIPMAVASSGWRDHVVGGLERNGIIHLFDAIVTADDEAVKNPKPAPDIFKVAAERISVCPTKCVGFEDANFGMQSIQDAKYMYACDVRRMLMYPRNVERRLSTMRSEEQKDHTEKKK